MSVRSTEASQAAATQAVRTAAKQAAKAENEAAQRIQDSQQKVEAAQRDTQKQLDDIKDQYEKNSLVTSEKQAGALERQMDEGYERIRKAKLEQQKEVDRVRREGENRLKDTQEFYHKSITDAEYLGNEKLLEAQAQNAREIGHIESNSKFAETSLQKDRETQLNQIKQGKEDAIAQAKAQSELDLEKASQEFTTAKSQRNALYNQHYNDLIKNQNEMLTQLNNRANDQLMSLRDGHSRKLAAYDSRQSDPFYQLVDLNPVVHENDDVYMIQARIPEHEQKHVSISVRDNHVVLAGQRRSDEKLDAGFGRIKSTSSFQSYHEVIPISTPVNEKAVEKQFEGDMLTIILPKKGGSYIRPAYKRPVEPVTAQKPNFPKDLPGVNPNESTSVLASKKKGSPPLGWSRRFLLFA